MSETRKKRVSRVADYNRKIGADIRSTDEPVRRLIIEKVVLRNFKSYGGTTIIGPFHKRFTSIVGPNGSGKSNVIDAMLFVFGFRAKQMRFDKLSELIHNSSAYVSLNNNRPLESMEVAIHFCEILDHNPDVDDFEVIEGSRLIISREVLRDNTSKYKINGMNASQKQVSNSLKSFGMDLYNNRFLILQGEVEQISQMKPKATKPDEEGLLEYLEDIIGTNQYLEGIREAQIEYENFQDQYQERVNRVRAAQKEVDDLAEAKAEADKYLENEASYYRLKLLLAQKSIYDASRKRAELGEKLGLMEENYRQIAQEMEKVDVDALASEIAGVEAELESLKKVQKSLSETFKKLCAKDEDLRKQLLREVNRVEEKSRAIKICIQRKPQYEEQAKQKFQKSEELNLEIPKVQLEVERIEAEFEALSEELRPEMEAATKHLEECEQKLAPIQQSLDQCKKEMSETETSIMLLEKKEAEGKEFQGKLLENRRRLEETVAGGKAKLAAEQGRLTQYEEEAEVGRRRIEELEGMIKVKSSDYIKKRGQYESMKRDLEESSGHQKQYRHIMKLANSGFFKGVHGRLGDLGSISPQYEKAFIAAGGSFVDMIIVDTPEVASKIFEELRKQNLGRATAMALTVLNNDLRRRMEAAEKDNQIAGIPQEVQRIVDLIQPINPKYKICFYYALRDTLVAKNLEDATRVGYEMHRRVVTLEGELIEQDGRMSGGGTANMQGKGLKGTKSIIPYIDEDVVKGLGREVEAGLKELTDLRNELQNLNQRQHELTKKLNETRHLIDIERQNLSNDEMNLRMVLGSIDKCSGTSLSAEERGEMDCLKLRLREKMSEFVAIETELKEREKVVRNAYESMQNIGKGKLKKKKLVISQMESKLATMRGDLEDFRRQGANLLADAEKCDKDVAKFEADILKHRERSNSLESQLDDLENEAAKVNDTLVEKKGVVDSRRKYLDQIRASYEERCQTRQQHQMKSLEMKHEIEEMGKEVKAMEMNFGKLIEKLEELVRGYKKTRQMIQTSESSSQELRSSNETGLENIIILDDEEEMGEYVLGDHLIGHLGGDGPVRPLLYGQSGGDSTANKIVDNVVDNAADKGVDKGADNATNLPIDNADQSEDARDGGSSSLLRELKELEVEDLKRSLAETEGLMESVPNLGVIDDFRFKVHELIKKKADMRMVQEKRDESKMVHEQLCYKRRSEFLSNFAIIATKLKEMYQTITLGGDAELELLDSTDPFTEGILFSVRPAKKSWKQIQNLSGGEKTLSSLALVFALHHYKPNPVYFMDEIDAALDFRNVSIIAQNIKERTKDAQFIIISLRNQMFELCNQMVGIYKTLDVTKSVCINPAAYDLTKKKELGNKEK